ncbi:MAG: aldehyde dehydrogenase family protein, partial [Pseudomonadota bacterium]
MLDKTAFYINGSWVAPASQERAEVINPADETACATIALANERDVDQAVAAAKAAFPAYAALPLAERIGLLEKLLEIYQARADDMATAISMEMGAP